MHFKNIAVVIVGMIALAQSHPAGRETAFKRQNEMTIAIPTAPFNGKAPSRKRDLPGADIIGDVTSLLPVDEITKNLPVGGGAGGILSGLLGKRALPGADPAGQTTRALPVGGSPPRGGPFRRGVISSRQGPGGGGPPRGGPGRGGPPPPPGGRPPRF